MAEIIVGKDANSVWTEAVLKVKNISEVLPCRTGSMRELPHVLMVIENPQQKWVYSRQPAMSIAFALAELVWILKGENDAKVINFWNSALPKFAGYNDYYHGAYGNRIRRHLGYDQLTRAFYALQSVPESRQVVIQIYDAVIDAPLEDGLPRDADIPCNICSMIKIRNNKLEWSQIMRSNDILLGTPYNFVQFTSIMEILAGWLEIGIKSYNHYSDSLHVYERDINRIGIDDMKEIKNDDHLSIKKNDFDPLINEMFQRMKNIACNNLSDNQINDLSMLDSGYTAYDNMMLMITAYAARKKKDFALAQDIVGRCTNMCYVRIWNNWINK